MKTVYQKNELLQGESKFCPGCGHGIVNKLIAEVLSENGWAGKAIECLCIGCAINMTEYVNWDILACPHGRAAAVATGVSRVNKDAVVFTYQGDGDAGGIGLAETFHAARYEKPVHRNAVNRFLELLGRFELPTSSLPKWLGLH